jgi:tRNA(Ile)-lysidine synthase
MNHNKFLDKVKAAIFQYNMIQRGDRIAVAVSGGADSVALLDALYELREEQGIEVAVCHVNHNLRGEESNRDETFVHELCSRYRILDYCFNVDVKSLQKKHQSLEEAAREARYAAFAKFTAWTKVATAHTAGDNAETVLLNLIRGTGLKGLVRNSACSRKNRTSADFVRPRRH